MFGLWYPGQPSRSTPGPSDAAPWLIDVGDGMSIHLMSIHLMSIHLMCIHLVKPSTRMSCRHGRRGWGDFIVAALEGLAYALPG